MKNVFIAALILISGVTITHAQHVIQKDPEASQEWGMTMHEFNEFPQVSPLGIEPIVQEMMLYDGWREKRIRIYSCYRRSSYLYTIQYLVKIPLLTGHRVFFKFSEHADLLPQHALMPLTHRTYESNDSRPRFQQPNIQF